ncbi:cyclase family protein [Caenispirillum salinarum]|uniref:cyclase family protein n=1 Tax=Caenispirillum salinarum TaxID=859058 RepID=UPI00384F85D6
MRTAPLRAAALAVPLALLLGSAAVAQDDRATFDSPYGPDDQIGAANNMTPDTVKAAAGLVTEGKVYPLGMTVDRATPAFPPRSVSVTVVTPSQGMGKTFGPNRGSYNDDIFHGWLGVGTQIDGLGHLGRDHVYYNNNKAEDLVNVTGLTKLGIEQIPPIATRGVLVNMAAHEGVEQLEGGHAISAQALQDALSAQGTTVGKGDVMIVHTGWMDKIGEDNETWGSTEPGLDVDAAEWLAEQGVVAVGADNWGLEAVPSADGESFFPVHVTLLAENGVYILENIVTRELVADDVNEFLFVLGPARVKGAVQMIINPVAIK